MAKKVDFPSASAPQVLLPMEIPLAAQQVKYLASMVDSANTDTDVRKAQSAILRLIEDQTAGGLMLNVQEVKRITDSTGLDPSCGADLLPFLQASTGRKDGCRTITIKVDPAYEPALQDIASVRGMDIESICRDTMQVCFDNSWYEHLPIQPRHIMVTEADHAWLEDALGAKFVTGTDLVNLVRKLMGGESGLFGGPDVPAEMVQ